MGVSRDYTTGNAGYGVDDYRRKTPFESDSTVLTRSKRATRKPRKYSADRDHRAAQIAAEPKPESSLLGATRLTRTELKIRQASDKPAQTVSVEPVVQRSKLVVGKDNGALTKLIVYSLIIMVSGVCLAMWLSGISTRQTFQIQELSAQESTLNNQIETLDRDLENVRSAADVSRRAVESSMGVPVQAGIIEVQENGDITQRREAKPEMDSIIDVNGAPVRPGQASSNPQESADVAAVSAPQIPALRARAPYSQ